jgi:hypothetical protein
VPAGHSDGGQWTADGTSSAAPRRGVTVDHTGQETWSSFADTYRPDGSLAEQRVFNRDGSRIVSEFNPPGGPNEWDERHTVITKDGRKLTFETAADVQRIYDAEGNLISASVWGNDGPEPLPVGQLALLPLAGAAIGAAAGVGVGVGSRLAVQKAIEAAAAILFGWLSTRNGSDGTAAYAPRVQEYEAKEGTYSATWVGQLSEEQLKKFCPKYPTVQSLTDGAAAATNRGNYKSASEYGTAVHKSLELSVKARADPELLSEVSVLKTVEETGERPPSPPPQQKPPAAPREIPYGTKGSIRIDVLERSDGTKMVCVYDIKTGKSGLSAARVKEIAKAVFDNFGPAKFMIIEVRPPVGGVMRRPAEKLR